MQNSQNFLWKTVAPISSNITLSPNGKDAISHILLHKILQSAAWH